MEQMTDRETALRKLAVGDIFHGECSNAASLICLVTSVTETTIHARRVTTQEDLVFDRQVGIVLCDDGTHGDGSIDSVAPLPPEMHDVFLGMDLRYGRGDDPKLTEAEKRALYFIADFYPANPV